MEDAKKAGKIRSIGVSNMSPKIWQEFVPNFSTMPSVNQVEFNPFCQQKELRKLMEPADVRIEAWAPLGQGNQALFENAVINRLAKKYNCSVAQVILRFEEQDGAIILPKSIHTDRMRSNLEIFDFGLTDSEMDEMRSLDQGHGLHDPDAQGIKERLLSSFDVHAQN